MSNANSTVFATSVGGCTGDDDICKMWQQHFSKLYNSIPVTDARHSFYERMWKLNELNTQSAINVNVKDVTLICSRQKRNRSAGPDGIAMEAYIFGGRRLYIHLTMLFRLFLKYEYLPESFMESTMVPLVKCKSGDLHDTNNYRAIALANSVSKIFESLILTELENNDSTDYSQFGFRPGHSTALCTNVLKSTVNYFVCRGGHVFTCFVDFSKAFDNVNYWKLFNMLLDDNVNKTIVSILAFWYSHQQVKVRWHNTESDLFKVGNGTRQGGVLSPILFTRYIKDVLTSLRSSRFGCNVGGLLINVLAYADDIVLLAPTWRGLQCLLDILDKNICEIDMVCNVNKTVCMVFEPKNRSMIIANSFPSFKIGLAELKFVNTFKYLGHYITYNLSDNFDIQREIKSMFVRANILLRKFAKCSRAVKLILFKSYCLCMYGNALWRSFHTGVYHKLYTCYNKCIKLFFGYSKRYSVTQMLLELGLPSFHTYMVNSRKVLHNMRNMSNNYIIAHFCGIGVE
jgi:hypothetical protein